MRRKVEAEILDSLPENHPDAIANRRDLRLINTIMGNPRWFSRELSRRVRPSDHLLEIGSGTGELGLFVHRKLAGRLPSFCGIDFWKKPPNWPTNWDWSQEDLLTSNRYTGATILLANLILHQFEADALEKLGTQIRDSGIRLILANEPARHRIHQFQLQLLRPLGLHPVSRHDGHVSITAGFRNQELPTLLGLHPDHWEIEIRRDFLGSYRMIARRKESAE